MAEKISRIYSNFRGVDFRGNEINLTRSPDSLNVWKDYKETESIRTRPGMKPIFERFQELGPIYGIFMNNGYYYVHAGDCLFQIITVSGPTDGYAFTVVYEGVNTAPSNGFLYEGAFYFLDGTHYIRTVGGKAKEVEGYIPTTTIARKPHGGGTKYEDVNMLSAYRKNSFLSDGGSFDYYLDVRNIDDDFVPEVTVNGEQIREYDTLVNGVPEGVNFTVDYEEGKITFLNSAPDAPLTDGQDNVIIKFKKEVPGYKENIFGCKLIQLFDNRVFFSGNPNYPNVVWHCSLNDPSYVSDLDYYREGLDSANVKGLVAGNNALWVFREPSSANTTVFYHTPTLDDEYGKIYPSTHSSVTTGCVGKAINFNDDIVFFSERGMEGISGDVTTEQVVAHRSSLVDRKMLAEPSYKDMILEEWEGYLLVFIGSKVYLADSRTAFTNEDHIEYDWFYWDMGKKINCTSVYDGVLYLGTDDGLYTLTDMEADVESYWVTPLDKFNRPQLLKTTNKRGCVAEAKGDISVYAKTEKTDFEHIGDYENVTDYFVSRIKRKKFKDIQLKFYSKTRFSLETVTIEAFIGGYIKR